MDILRATAGIPNIVRAPDKTITFTGAANLGAAGSNVTVYTITGRVLLAYFPPPFCTTNLGEAAPTATISLGTTTTVDLWISATNSVDIDQNEWWWATGASNVVGSGVELVGPDRLGQAMLSNDIVIACAAQNTNAGVLVFQGLHYIPLTSGASLA